MLTGPDCSHHQGDVDWRAVASAHQFTYLKATDGVAYRYTSWFATHLPRAKAAGLVAGAYHFLLSTHAGADQARFFVDTVNRSGGFKGILAVVDVERPPSGAGPSYRQILDFAAAFARLVPDHPLLVYTNRDYWVNVLGNPNGSRIGPLAHARWAATPGALYGGWSHWTLWQFTDHAISPGIARPCDMNRFDGDRDALVALTGRGGLFVHLTEQQEKQIYDAIVGSRGRLARIETAVHRHGYLARNANDDSPATVYFVASDQQSKLGMPVGSPLHEYIKSLQRIAGLSDRAAPVDPAVLDQIPPAG
jgi:GH25 family lysozyme M1 (1,4-beta-N-acetylmuramidase)